MAFLTTCISLVHARSRLLLKARALYAADGRAARELLKLASLLLQAVEAAQQPQQPQPVHISMVVRPSDLASIKASAQEIASFGGKLQDLLAKEPQAREARSSAGRVLELLSAGPTAGGPAYEQLETQIRDSTLAAQEEGGTLAGQAQDLGEDEATLQGRVHKRQAELGRASKRLESLASVRPSFMDEYERLEGDLAEEHGRYVTKARNLDYLNDELASLRRVRRKWLHQL